MIQKIAFIFPGQGSQFVGMAKDLYGRFEAVRKLYDRAEEILKFPIKKISFEGPEEELKQTRYTQPAIFIHSLAVDLLVRERGLAPEGVAGHSLGEYSALTSAGALSFEDGLQLVKIRAELMQHSGERNPGTMAAIIGLDNESIWDICRNANHGDVTPANFNSPGQVVISGSLPAVEAAMNLAKKRGARMVKQLPVGGAFHSPLMKIALGGLTEALREVKIQTPQIPVYSNVEAKPVTEPEKIRQLLQQQLLAPVLWEDIVRNMISDGFTKFFEIGPAKVLQGLLKRINRETDCQTFGTADDIYQISEK